MSIADWPNHDKPREKLLLQGEKMLTDAELLAILLTTGVKGKTSLDIAKEILQEFGGLKRLMHGSYADIRKKTGVGLAKYAMIKAAIELGLRCLSEIIEIGEKLNNSQRTQDFLQARLQHYPHEVFFCIFLDQHCRVLRYEEIFHGTIAETTIYPRELIRRCLTYNAAKIILAHNHPSGISTPSNTDRVMTRQLQKTLALVDIQVLDHIVVSTTQCFSFAKAGWL